jgi:hypothetical protein
MLVLLFAALLGGLVTTVVLSPYGLFFAFAWAPIGGSALATAAGLMLLLLRTRAQKSQRPRSASPHHQIVEAGVRQPASESTPFKV